MEQPRFHIILDRAKENHHFIKFGIEEPHSHRNYRLAFQMTAGSFVPKERTKIS